jgi:hypothetical protein
MTTTPLAGDAPLQHSGPPSDSIDIDPAAIARAAWRGSAFPAPRTPQHQSAVAQSRSAWQPDTISSPTLKGATHGWRARAETNS